jgi:hypothetical protein
MLHVCVCVCVCVCMYVCSLSYPACNAHAPYCHLSPAPLYNIFPYCMYSFGYFPGVRCRGNTQKNTYNIQNTAKVWNQEYFSTLSHKRHDFCIVNEHKMCVLISSANFVCNISHCKKNRARYDHKCMSVCCMWSAGYYCQVLMKLGFSREIFEKYSNMKSHEYPSNRSWVVPCGQTDGQTWRSW